MITGTRRCGKSVILNLIRERLLRNGVDDDHILYMNFESFQWIDITDAKSLYNHISPIAGFHLNIQRRNSIFLS
ncbi:AAA family ATPase [uncultured Bacteroides sp.]|uniref:AAA family ATPase n=1 Tax=uncultured Bacteroides sp. TaxID=162156 RepID=UPI0026176F0F|nr:AAA family ATPase [uncultured Bacteroides sp.]